MESPGNLSFSGDGGDEESRQSFNRSSSSIFRSLSDHVEPGVAADLARGQMNQPQQSQSQREGIAPPDSGNHNHSVNNQTAAPETETRQHVRTSSEGSHSRGENIPEITAEEKKRLADKRYREKKKRKAELADKLEPENKELRQEIASQKAVVDDHKKRLAEEEDKVDDLTKRLAEEEKKLDDLTKRLAEKEKEVVDLTEKLAKKEKKGKEQYAAKEKELETCRGKVEQAKALEIENKWIRHENVFLKAELDELKKKLAEEVAEKKEQYAVREKEGTQYKERIKELESKNQHLSENYIKLLEKVKLPKDTARNPVQSKVSSRHPGPSSDREAVNSEIDSITQRNSNQC